MQKRKRRENTPKYKTGKREAAMINKARYEDAATLE